MEIGVGMEVRLLSVGARGFFSRRFATRLRRSILSPLTRKKPLAPRLVLIVNCMGKLLTHTVRKSQSGGKLAIVCLQDYSLSLCMKGRNITFPDIHISWAFFMLSFLILNENLII